MPNVNRIMFTLFGFPIYWYGALIAIGMLLGILLASAREGIYRLKKDTVYNFVLIAIPAALVCARIYYVAFSWSEYSSDPLQIFNVRNGGMAIYGGVIGGVVTGLIYSRIKKISFGTLADLCAPSLALGQAIGRWGNFFNQEAYGPALEEAALQFFPIGVYIESLGHWRYATFFYESAWCFAIAAGLLIAERKKLFCHRGDVFLWYALTYSAERMVVEGMRSDSLYLGGIRISQLLSASMLVACGIIFLVRAFKIGRRPICPGILFLLFSFLLPWSFLYLSTAAQAAHSFTLILLGGIIYKTTKLESRDLNA